MAERFHSDSLYTLDGLVAVVTGGGTGLGAVIAKTLESNGASKVYITGRRMDRLESTAKEAKHGNIIPIQADVNSHEDLQRAVDQVTKEVGHIDLLVCNAGLTTWDASEERPMPTAESSAAEVRDYFFNYRPASIWRQCLDTNIASVFDTCMAFLVLLEAGNKRPGKDKQAPTSQIIATGSVGGMTRYTPSYIYNASKAGVHHLMKNLGAAFIPFDIRTNVIAPGWFPSEMTERQVKQWEPTGGVMPRSLVPGQRMGKHEEMAGTIMYLVSRAGAYCNGNVVVIDGGFLHNHAGP